MTLRTAFFVARRAAANREACRTVLGDLRLPKDDATASVRVSAAIAWLCRAQDAVSGGGVSYGLELGKGWLPPYPETTGYIITTFLRWAGQPAGARPGTDESELRARAQRMARWLVTLQMDSGALPGGILGTPPAPTVFNTGQILEGWCQAYRNSKDEAIASSLARAARWLAEVQDGDGCWRRFLSPLTLQMPATYNARTAAALLDAAELLSEQPLRSAAIRNFDWVLRQQRDNGWFAGNCLTDERRPLTHTIGYTLEGLLEAGIRLGDGRYLDAVVRASRPLWPQVGEDGFLSGRFDEQWRPAVTWSCLTGACQLAAVWFRLARVAGLSEASVAAVRLMSFVKRTQRLASSGHAADESGGIKGSHPVWGAYDPFRYPNWAAKFFLDALLEETRGA